MVESEKNKGSTFKFFFDVTPVAEEIKDKSGAQKGYQANLSELYFDWKPKRNIDGD